MSALNWCLGLTCVCVCLITSCCSLVIERAVLSFGWLVCLFNTSMFRFLYREGMLNPLVNFSDLHLPFEKDFVRGSSRHGSNMFVFRSLGLKFSSYTDLLCHNVTQLFIFCFLYHVHRKCCLSVWQLNEGLETLYDFYDISA